MNSPGATEGIKDGIAFAAARNLANGHATGVYFEPTCGATSSGTDPALLDTLNRLSVGTTRPWTDDANAGCGSTASVIATATQFSDFTTSDFPTGQCPVRKAFPTFETDFVPIAVATDTSSAVTCGTDTTTLATTCGLAYYLAAGPGLTAATPDIVLSSSSPLGTAHAITAIVTNGVGGPPLVGQPVTFTVSGANSGASGNCVPTGCTSNASGGVTFVYAGLLTGKDTIIATIVCNGAIQTATTSMTSTATAPAIALSPPTGSSPVGAIHAVTATLTSGEHGPPLVGQVVAFTVSGANDGAAGSCVPANCSSNGAGKMTFTYRGANSGGDTITATVNARGTTQVAAVAMTWTSTTPTISLGLKNGSSQINTTHTVTATITRGSGGPPLGGQRVSFSVAGVNGGAPGPCAPTSCLSNRAGKVTFTYTGAQTGTDTITASITTGGQIKSDTASMTWTAAASNASTIFQVELRTCTTLHVGYDNFPSGTIVHWTVSQHTATVATKQFRAIGGAAQQFLTLSLGAKLQPTIDGLVHFSWVANGVQFSYTATRKPGC